MFGKENHFDLSIAEEEFNLKYEKTKTALVKEVALRKVCTEMLVILRNCDEDLTRIVYDGITFGEPKDLSNLPSNGVFNTLKDAANEAHKSLDRVLMMLRSAGAIVDTADEKMYGEDK